MTLIGFDAGKCYINVAFCVRTAALAHVVLALLLYEARFAARNSQTAGIRLLGKLAAGC